MNNPQAHDAVLGNNSRVIQFPDTLSTSAVLGFQASDFQKAIFNWIKTGEGHCVVSAVPGSGKTTTLIKAAQSYIMSQSSFYAFNKHIVQELQRKLPQSVSTSTIHSLGFKACRQAGITELDDSKYWRIMKQVKSSKPEFENLAKPIVLKTILDFARNTLTQPDSDSISVMLKDYNIPYGKNLDILSRFLARCFEFGMQDESLDFNDMVWLPVVKKLRIAKSDFVLVDEAQDLTRAQLALVTKSFNTNTRSLFVGDPHQAIMGFASADYRSMANIIEKTDAIELPLSISYRCPRSHVELANKVHNVIQPSEHAIYGSIDTLPLVEVLDTIEPGDLIICRCGYPLVKIYFRLISQGKTAFFKGRNLADQLLYLLNLINPSQTNFKRDLQTWLSQWCENNKDASQLLVDSYHDKLDCLEELYDRCDNNIETLKAQLKTMSESKYGILLSTVHGAKGLEADRVFVVDNNLMPHPKATGQAELIQEANLKFVAYTRSKRELYFTYTDL